MKHRELRGLTAAGIKNRGNGKGLLIKYHIFHFYMMFKLQRLKQLRQVMRTTMSKDHPDAVTGSETTQ